MKLKKYVKINVKVLTLKIWKKPFAKIHLTKNQDAKCGVLFLKIQLKQLKWKLIKVFNLI